MAISESTKQSMESFEECMLRALVLQEAFLEVTQGYVDFGVSRQSPKWPALLDQVITDFREAGEALVQSIRAQECAESSHLVASVKGGR
jgi:hypothetical protein